LLLACLAGKLLFDDNPTLGLGLVDGINIIPELVFKWEICIGSRPGSCPEAEK
jgi:hypothetical protein